MNAHAVGTGWLANNNPGYPGYSGEIPLDAADARRDAARGRLRDDHDRQVAQHADASDCVASGPKHSWPAQRGFDTFYGFMEGEAHFFFPAAARCSGNQLVPIDEYPRDYYSTDDWTDRGDPVREGAARVVARRSPSCSTSRTTRCTRRCRRSPRTSRSTAAATTRAGRRCARRATAPARDSGSIPPGTRLPASDPRVPRWDDTDPADRPLFARHMEAYAAMLDCVDQNVGRLVAFLESIGELDNTIIVFSSDNGGTDAGGPTGMFNNNRRYMGLAAAADRARARRTRTSSAARAAPRSIRPAWGEVSNTPFPSFKTYTGAGGRRVSFIVSWPARIRDARRDPPAVRARHRRDADAARPRRRRAARGASTGCRRARMHGASFAPVLFDAGRAARRAPSSTTSAGRTAPTTATAGSRARSRSAATPIDLDNWTLHDLDERLLRERWTCARSIRRSSRSWSTAFDAAAWQYFVYPLDNRDRLHKFADQPPQAQPRSPTGRARSCPGAQTRAPGRRAAADRRPRRSASACASPIARATQGVLWAIGDPTGGMVMYVEDGRLHFHYNGFGDDDRRCPACALPAGEHEATLEYEALGGREGAGGSCSTASRRCRLDARSRRRWCSTACSRASTSASTGAARCCGRSTSATARSPTAGAIRDVIIEPGARPGHEPRGAEHLPSRRAGAARSPPGSRRRRRPRRYPCEAIRAVIVPTVPGGALDNVARMLASAWASASASSSWSRTAAARPA